jgi:hypothetical protein
MPTARARPAYTRRSSQEGQEITDPKEHTPDQLPAFFRLYAACGIRERPRRRGGVWQIYPVRRRDPH